MTAARSIFAGLLIALAAMTVFSPLIAALTASGGGFEFSADAQSTLPRSILIAATAACTAVAIGFPFALATDHAHPRLRRCGWALGVLSLIVPPYIVAESTIVLLGPAGFISRGAALMLGLGPAAADATARARFAVPGLVYTPVAAGIVIGGCLFPIVALAVAGAYRRIDRRTFDAARLIGGRPAVLRVAAQTLVPTAIGGGLFVLALALTESVVPQLLRVRTVGDAIYEAIQEGNLSAAANISLPMLPLIVASGAGGAYLVLRSRSASLAGLEGDVPKFEPGPSTPLRDTLAVVLAGAAAAIPLGIPLIGLSTLVARATLPAATAGGHRVLRASGFWQSFGGAVELAHVDALRTAIFAVIAATTALLVSVLLVRLLGGGRGAYLLGGLGAGLAVPAPIVGLGLIVLWNRPHLGGIYQSGLVILLAWMARFFPISLLLVQAALARVPRELEHAAALAGRGRAGRFIAAVLPSAMPGLIAAWLAVYVLAATEFVATLLVAPAGMPMLAPSVVNLMRRGQDPEIAACQMLLLLVVAAPLFFLAAAGVLRARWSAS